MIFHGVNKFAFVSECKNYMVTIANASKQLLYSCHRVNQDNPGKWDNINEQSRSYLTYQEATNRINQVHKAEPEKAYKIAPKMRDRATQDQAKAAIQRIKKSIE